MTARRCDACGAPLSPSGCTACARLGGILDKPRKKPWFNVRQEDRRDFTCVVCKTVFQAPKHVPRKYCGPKCAATAPKRKVA